MLRPSPQKPCLSLGLSRRHLTDGFSHLTAESDVEVSGISCRRDRGRAYGEVGMTVSRVENITPRL